MGKLTPQSVATAPASLATACLLFLLGLVLVSPVRAQSAANFDTKTLTPETSVPVAEKTAKPEKAVKKTPKAIGPVSTVPSRYVTAADLESHLASISSVFVIQNRSFDPFGQPQDPDAKPVVKLTVATAVKRGGPVQATPFADIVRLLVVTTIMPGEKRFLVGARSIKEGDQIPLSFHGKPIRVQITKVTSSEIGFRNLDSGETASRKLDLLPAGMTPGNQGISAPGMVQDHPNAPIELEASNPAP